jgi:hypothetical protein
MFIATRSLRNWFMNPVLWIIQGTRWQVMSTGTTSHYLNLVDMLLFYPDASHNPCCCTHGQGRITVTAQENQVVSWTLHFTASFCAPLQSWGNQVVIKFRQNWFKQETKQYCLRSTISLILFGIRKNCLINGRSLLLYQFTNRVIKPAVVIIVGHHCYQLHTKFYRISSSHS